MSTPRTGPPHHRGGPGAVEAHLDPPTGASKGRPRTSAPRRSEERPDDSGEVGSLLRRARHVLGWSLADAAEASGGRFKPSTIASYERGERRVAASTLFALAELYETSVSVLLPPSVDIAGQSAALLEQISRLPATHRALIEALVEQMHRDTRSAQLT